MESDEKATPPETLELAIEPAIELKGGRYDALRLREPRVIEVRQAESHLRSSVNVETMRKFQIALIAKVADVPEPVIEGLPISTLNKAMEYLQSFMDAGQGTGRR